MKDSIRKKLLSLRKSKSSDEVKSKSQKIKEILFKTKEFNQSKTILFYVSKGNEVGTKNMIKESLELGKRVVVTITDVKNIKLILSELKNLEELEIGTFGMLEPKKEFFRPVKIEEIDLVIVPGVAFDEEGNRIGFGKGFYDRFLITLKKDVPNIGLAYEFQLVEKIPVTDKDVKVSKIITEKRIIEC
jgi:5-formyltetrahydrofolate cyclo-ligase